MDPAATVRIIPANAHPTDGGERCNSTLTGRAHAGGVGTGFTLTLGVAATVIISAAAIRIGSADTDRTDGRKRCLGTLTGRA